MTTEKQAFVRIWYLGTENSFIWKMKKTELVQLFVKSHIVLRTFKTAAFEILKGHAELILINGNNILNFFIKHIFRKRSWIQMWGNHHQRKIHFDGSTLFIKPQGSFVSFPFFIMQALFIIIFTTEKILTY